MWPVLLSGTIQGVHATIPPVTFVRLLACVFGPSMGSLRRRARVSLACQACQASTPRVLPLSMRQCFHSM
jgi:hypothetical protein